MNKRVVITGLGVVSSIGIGCKAFWQALTEGKSGITPIQGFDTSDFSNHLGGEVKDFSPEDFISAEKAAKIGRASQFAIAAAKMALSDAGMDISKAGLESAGVAIGTTMAETQIFQEVNSAWVKEGPGAVEAKLLPVLPASAISASIASELGLKGVNFVIPTACAAGNYAIGFAFDRICAGDAELMLAGGTDAFSRLAFTGFNRLLAIAPDKVQPFDRNRKGMMVGEGAGVVLLEELESARKRNARIYAEIAGYGLSCDAHHMTAPFSEGIAEAIVKALKESKLTAEEVDYYNAHGTGTPANDKEECMAIHKVFGAYAKKLAVSSIKSMLGHTMGAASAIESVACALSVKNDIVPPTINFQTPDPECDIDCVPNVSRRLKVSVALNNASAFGGNNACLVLKKFQ